VLASSCITFKTAKVTQEVTQKDRLYKYAITNQ
jgi:hypothetical protein